MVLQRPLHCLLSAVLVLQWNVASAFYVPGVAPTEYKQGDLLDIKVGSVLLWSAFFFFTVSLLGCFYDKYENTATLRVLQFAVLSSGRGKALQVVKFR